MTANEIKIQKNTMKKGKLYNQQGLLTLSDVEVVEAVETITIGATEHLKSDLVLKGDEITPITDKNQVPLWTLILDL